MKHSQLMTIILLLSGLLLAEKKVGGIISTDTKWTAEDGPYIVEKDILISATAQLTISPGTKVLIRNSPLIDTTVYQTDQIDSHTVSIKVEGILICLGRKDRRTSFAPLHFFKDKYSWYGIIYKNASDIDNELSGTDIAGAYKGISIIASSPVIRSSTLEYNHIGISCHQGSSAKVYNCVIARNFATGIMISKSNPHLANNIIAYNRNNGLWCDGFSKVHLEYNCFYDNHDGNFLECDPEFGILIKTNHNKDSVDYVNNVFTDPVFSGSVSDSLATERDYRLPTIRSRVKDTTLAAILYDGKPLPESVWKTSDSKYILSSYSPCINSGHPSNNFKDIDGSRNDMGIDGGPDYLSKKK